MKLGTTYSRIGNNRWYFVWDATVLVWQGKAHNAADARSQYLSTLIQS